MKNFLYGCDEAVLEQELPSSIISNFRLTADPRGLGLIAIGDILLRVANVRRVGEGDIPAHNRITLWRLVGEGEEHEFEFGNVTCKGLLNSSLLLNVQFSFMTNVRSS